MMRFKLRQKKDSSQMGLAVIMFKGDLLDVRYHLDQHPTMYQVRWIPTAAMFVGALTKYLPDQTALENLMKNNVYPLREDPRLKEIRNKSRTEKKKRTKSKAKAKPSTAP